MMLPSLTVHISGTNLYDTPTATEARIANHRDDIGRTVGSVISLLK